MKALLAVIVVGLCCLTARAEDWTVNGKDYHNVTVNKVDPDKVHITYDGGIGSVNLADLPPDLQKRFNYDPVKAKASSTNSSPDMQYAYMSGTSSTTGDDADTKEIEAEADALAKATTEAEKDYSKAIKGTLSGQIFIASKGGENFKLGDVTVYLFSIEQGNALLEESLKRGNAQMRADLPKPMEETISDADGKFTIPIPISGTKTVYEIYAHASRQVGDDVEEYDWMVSVPSSVDKPFLLTNDNLL